MARVSWLVVLLVGTLGLAEAPRPSPPQKELDSIARRVLEERRWLDGLQVLVGTNRKDLSIKAVKNKTPWLQKTVFTYRLNLENLTEGKLTAGVRWETEIHRMLRHIHRQKHGWEKFCGTAEKDSFLAVLCTEWGMFAESETLEGFAKSRGLVVHEGQIRFEDDAEVEIPSVGAILGRRVVVSTDRLDIGMEFRLKEGKLIDGEIEALLRGLDAGDELSRNKAVKYLVDLVPSLELSLGK